MLDVEGAVLLACVAIVSLAIVCIVVAKGPAQDCRPPAPAASAALRTVSV